MKPFPKPTLPTLLLAVAVVASCALLLALGDGLTFFQDTWAFLLERQGTTASDFLRPHNEHISVIPVAIEKLLIETFGMTTALPERVLLTAMLATTAVLVFVYVRRRVGPWPALFAAVALLFLGPAWEVLLWGFEVSLVGSLLTGVAMLLALERKDRRGDLIACLLLVLSVGFSSLGVAFIAGAGADVLARRRTRGLSRAWVAAVPVAVYAAWYLGYGHETESAVSLRNAIHAPPFVLESIAAAFGSLLGVRALVGSLGDTEVRALGLLGLVALAALLTYLGWRRPGALFARRRLPGVSTATWAAAASAGAFWGLAALNRLPGREPTTSRYLHIGAVFVLVVAADLLSGARFRKQALAVAGVVLAITVGSNIVSLVEGRDTLAEQTVLTRSELAAIEIAGRSVEPYFRLGPEIAGTPSLINVSAEPYLKAVDEHGSPAYSRDELAQAPAAGRRQADIVVAAALPLTATTGPTARARLGGDIACIELDSGEQRLRPGSTLVEVAPGPPTALLLRRFATSEHPVRFDVPGGSATLLQIPPDRAQRPWWLRTADDRRARVCSRHG